MTAEIAHASGKERFRVLDAWRGIAALAVALFHLSAAGHFYYVGLVRNAGTYVDFFFVLSGFVITHSYLDRLRSGADIRKFLIKRIGRLWPLHIAMLSILVALELAKLFALKSGHLSAGSQAFTNDTSVPALVANIFLLHSMGLFHTYTWNGPSWSISVEFWTYMVFVIVARFARKRIVTVSCAVVLASIAILMTAHARVDSTYDWGFFRCVACFFIGVVIYAVYLRMSQWRIRWPLLWELVGLAMIAFTGSYYGVELLGFARYAVFGLVVLVFAREAGPFASLMKTSPFQSLGKWSYSIYLVHFVMLTVINAAVRVLQQKLKIPLRENVIVGGHVVDMINLGHSAYLNDILALVYLGLLIAISSFTYRFIEDPARHFFNRLAKRTDQAVLATAV